MTGGHAYWLGQEADGPDEVRKATREQLKRGVDVVKCITTGGVLMSGAITGVPEFAEAEIRTLAETASAKDIPTTTHAHGKDGIRNAARAGASSVEHGMFTGEEAADLMVDNGTYWVPAVSAVREVAEMNVEAGIPSEAVAKAEDAAECFEGAWSHVSGADVNTTMGTDAGAPFNDHGENALHEMELLVGYGLSPVEALEAATVGGTDLLGLDDVEKAAGGYVADLVVLDAGPSKDAGA